MICAADADEAWAHHADHGERPAGKVHGPAEYARVSRKPALPQPVAENHHAFIARQFLIQHERAAQHGLPAEQTEKSIRHAHTGEPLGPVDRKSTRLKSSHRCISYAVLFMKKKIK